MYISKNYGFSFSTEKSDIDLVDFLASLVGVEIQFKVKSGNVRKFMFDSDSHYFYGVVITMKNQRSFASLVDEKGVLKVKISDLADLEKIAEFNFFVINKLNGFGLYQYHYGACTLPNFGEMLKGRYRRHLEEKREKALGTLGENPSKKQLQAINSRFFHGLHFDMLVQSRDVETVLSAYREIRSFKYEVASVEASLSADSPFQGMVTKAKHEVRFDTSVDSSLIIEGIKSMISTVKDRTAKIEVVNDLDESAFLKIMDVPVNFGEMSYSDFMKGLSTFEPHNLTSCVLFKSLTDKCEKEYAHVFSKKVS
ncbi:hypothetical protein [Pseudomonas bohemica]|uniref:hypothetical protein n=1 Tax=Pseudomonas bohemica TaxID=2044872 RepID=UPI000DA5FFFC|nr:hypothetical protein [Pseudomonas bohemica]